jgi:hypothetical protein
VPFATGDGGGSVSSPDRSRLKREISEWEMTFLRGGPNGVVTGVVGLSRAPSCGGPALRLFATMLFHRKIVESAATVTIRGEMNGGDTPSRDFGGTIAISVMPSVWPQSRAIKVPYSE